MSGGQDEASEYIKTGGTNVFKKTERTKCGNCVFWDAKQHGMTGLCRHESPISDSDMWCETHVTDWCGEFVDREQFHQPVKEADTVKKPAGESLPYKCDKCGYVICYAATQELLDQLLASSRSCWECGNPCINAAGHFRVIAEQPKPAGELREWWVEGSPKGNHWDKAYHDEPCYEPGYIHAREVPSPERVRQALDAFAIQGGYEDWSEYKTGIPGLSNRILAILRSLGIDTEGV